MRVTRQPALLLPAVLIVLCIMVAGCRSSRQAAQADNKQSRSCSYLRLMATADCEMRGTTVNAVLRTECDSVIWLSASKIIELGRARLTRDSVALYIPLNNSFFNGTYDDVYQLTGVRTSFGEIQDRIGIIYNEQLHETAIDINARQLRESVNVKIKRIGEVAEQQKYPMHIPASAKPLK